jgi:glycosyltransferase involved in cell wall biosynthesis
VPPVAVVVCSRDRAALLRDALASVVAALRPGDEAIVVDSASKGVGTLAAAADAGLRAVRCDRPGLARARNVGVRATSAAVLAFTDDDCRVEPGWLDAVAQAFDAGDDRAIGFAFGRVLPVQDDGPRLSVRDAGERRRFGAPGPADPVDVGHGANMAFRRAALADIGGFDELLGAGAVFRAAEDHDAVWRALRRGWDGVYDPAIVVRHEQHRATSQWLRVRHGYGIGSGAFAAKAARIDPEAGRRLLRERLWWRGARAALVEARHGHVMPAAANAVQVAGVVRGALAARRRPLAGDRFATGGR